EERLAPVARGFFRRAARDRPSLFRCAHGGREAQRRSLARYERGVGTRAVTEPVVEVGDVQVPVELWRQTREHVQHRKRIGAARHGEQRPLAAFEESPLLDRAPHRREEIADRARLLAHTPTRDSHVSGARIPSSVGIVASLSQTLLTASRPARSATTLKKCSPMAYWSYFMSMPIARWSVRSA